MLSDAAIERYSRQILLPEVGGRGQERLCATSVTMRGDGDAATLAATLLAAAGVRVVAEPGPPDRLEVSIGGASVVGVGATVVTLVGRPCIRCAPATAWETADGSEASQALGALVAAETLSVALGLVNGGRVQTLASFEGHPLRPTDGCAACATNA